MTFRRLTRTNATALTLGGVILIVGSVVGWMPWLRKAILEPAPFIAMTLGLAGLVLAGWSFVRGLALLAQPEDPVRLVRGVRRSFVALALLVAGVGWLLRLPPAIVAGLVVAGVDLVETTFLLLVVTVRGDRA